MSETPREPDRYDKQAEQVAETWTAGHVALVDVVAAALRAAEADALERAARAFDDEYMRTGKMRTGNNVADELRAMRRAVGPAPSIPSGRDRCKCGVQEMEPGVTRMHELDGLVHSRTACVPSGAPASPAAAPAADCVDHWHCDPAQAAHACKADRSAPCPTCKAAPAAPADPCQRCGQLGGHPVDFRFGGMLTGRWICPHCLDAQEKRIADLEAAIRWACGEEGEFPTRRPGEGAYWWRTELRRRAGGGK